MSEKIPRSNPESNEPKIYLIPMPGNAYVYGLVNEGRQVLHTSKQRHASDMTIRMVEVTYETVGEDGKPVIESRMISDHIFSDDIQQQYLDSMNKNELITMPDYLKVATVVPAEVSTQAAITHVPEALKAEAGRLEQHAPVTLIEQAPFNVEVFQVPRMKLGEGVVKMIVEVPGVTSNTIAEPGTAIGPSRGRIVIGGLADYKGGNPGGVIGFKGIVRK